MVLPMTVVLGLIGLAGVGIIGGAFWLERLAGAREQREAAHPYAEVEPAKPPRCFHFIQRDQISEALAARLDKVHNDFLKEAPAPDFDPAVGDLVVALAELDARNSNGSVRTEFFMCRVLWPRDSYVRAQIVSPPVHAETHGLGARAVIDIPRAALATVLHVTGPPPAAVPAFGTS